MKNLNMKQYWKLIWAGHVAWMKEKKKDTHNVDKETSHSTGHLETWSLLK
jgi:hypothetical protein